MASHAARACLAIKAGLPPLACPTTETVRVARTVRNDAETVMLKFVKEWIR